MSGILDVYIRHFSVYVRHVGCLCQACWVFMSGMLGVYVANCIAEITCGQSSFYNGQFLKIIVRYCLSIPHSCMHQLKSTYGSSFEKAIITADPKATADVLLSTLILKQCDLVVDTWLRDQEVPGSSPGCVRSTLSPWERFFTCISSPHSCKKRVPDYRQCARVTRHL